MVKPAEIRAVCDHSSYDGALLAYTSVAVMGTDFLTGVLSACVLHGGKELTLGADSAKEYIATGLLLAACVPMMAKLAMAYQAAGEQKKASTGIDQ